MDVFRYTRCAFGHRIYSFLKYHSYKESLKVDKKTVDSKNTSRNQDSKDSTHRGNEVGTEPSAGRVLVLCI